jgi:hypothetical protein
VLIDQPAILKTRLIPTWLRVGASILLGLIAAAVAVDLLHSPFTVENVTKALEEASGRPVQIGTFSSSYFPPSCTAQDIRFLRHKHPNLSPIITIEKLTIRGSFTGMLSSPKRLAAVRIVGMHMIVASKEPDEGPEHVELNGGPGGQSLVISKITVDGAVLEFVRRSGKEPPYILKVDELALTDVGAGKPIDYRAQLTNSEPPGVIRAEGKFGPWNPDHIGETPASGTYAYDQIELSHFKSIYGSGNAHGEFLGSLERIRTHGRIDVRGFGVDGSHHAIPVTTQYDATVNGTNGDVLLDSAVASFQHTRLEVRGGIAGQKGEQGKTATLDLAVPQGRVDDLLGLFDDQPGMSGPVTLRGGFVWPPGPGTFVRKIRMDLTFGIDRSRFTSANTQGSIDRLSESAAGEKKGKIEEDPRTVLLEMRGGIRVRGGVATISNGAFHVPVRTRPCEARTGSLTSASTSKGLSTRAAIFRTRRRASKRCSSRR